jgi:anti-sigma regulatory factor (Ser/Thr protein kinase)
MASNEVTPSTWTAHKHTWQTLIEFDLSSEPGGEWLAADRVAVAIQRLNWPAAQLQQLKLALAQAARNAAECNCRYDSEGALAIRVLIPENDPSTQETNQARGESTQLQLPEVKAQQATQSSSRGWGFFLIDKAVPRTDRRDVRYLIELYLYPEGANRDPDSG